MIARCSFHQPANYYRCAFNQSEKEWNTFGGLFFVVLFLHILVSAYEKYISRC